MKTIFKLAFLFLAVSFTACTPEPGPEKLPGERVTLWGDIEAIDGRIVSPEWLVKEIKEVNDRYRPSPGTGRLQDPWIYVFEYEGQDYVLVWDMASSGLNNGMKFFTPSGEFVDTGPDPYSDLFYELMAASDDNGSLIWNNTIANQSGNTSSRAPRSSTYFETPMGIKFTGEEWRDTPAPAPRDEPDDEFFAELQ